MARAKLKITTAPGKAGTKLATGKLRVSKTDGKARMTGRPMFQTSVQIHAHFYNANGQPRARSR